VSHLLFLLFLATVNLPNMFFYYATFKITLPWSSGLSFLLCCSFHALLPLFPPLVSGTLSDPVALTLFSKLLWFIPCPGDQQKVWPGEQPHCTDLPLVEGTARRPRTKEPCGTTQYLGDAKRHVQVHLALLTISHHTCQKCYFC